MGRETRESRNQIQRKCLQYSRKIRARNISGTLLNDLRPRFNEKTSLTTDLKISTPSTDTLNKEYARELRGGFQKYYLTNCQRALTNKLSGYLEDCRSRGLPELLVNGLVGELPVWRTAATYGGRLSGGCRYYQTKYQKMHQTNYSTS